MNMELREKKIQSETIFDGQVLHERRDTVELPDGRYENLLEPGKNLRVESGLLALDGTPAVLEG